MKSLCIVLLLGLVGCGSVKHSNTGSGTVRNVWANGACYDVTFERDDGMLVVYDFTNKPAVWTGMHGTIEYDFDSGGYKFCAYVAGTVWRN